MNTKPRGILYVRKSDPRDGVGPASQVEWAIKRAADLGVPLNVSVSMLDSCKFGSSSESCDLYYEHGVSGHFSERPVLTLLLERCGKDSAITHVFVHK